MTDIMKSTEIEDPEKLKQKIIQLFDTNVRGKIPDSSVANIGHDGRGGHWLETQMGVTRNSKNAPDLYGFEMKNDTSSKTTFGDWSASCYIFKEEKYGINRDQFLVIFGAPNVAKKNRYSWSGKPIPKIDRYNSFGQILKVDEKDNIFIIYSYSEDQRIDKEIIVPKILQQDNLIIAEWKAEMMKVKVERKFNQRGWFKCLKDNEGVYRSIVFGPPMEFSFWIKDVRKGLIFFDSAMYQGNKRPYSQWRANNKYWDSLVTDTH